MRINFQTRANYKTAGIGLGFLSLVLALTILCLSMASCSSGHFLGCDGSNGFVGYSDKPAKAIKGPHR